MPHRLEFWPGTSSGYRSEPQRDVARIACDHQFVATRHQDEGSADQRPQKVASERSGQWIMAVYLRGGARWTPRRDFAVSNDGSETVTDREVIETGRDTPLPLGELSPVELVESRLDRIARLDTRLPKHARCARCTVVCASRCVVCAARSRQYASAQIANPALVPGLALGRPRW